jgi:hypothetical protein
LLIRYSDSTTEEIAMAVGHFKDTFSSTITGGTPGDVTSTNIDIATTPAIPNESLAITLTAPTYTLEVGGTFKDAYYEGADAIPATPITTNAATTFAGTGAPLETFRDRVHHPFRQGFLRNLRLEFRLLRHTFFG